MSIKLNKREHALAVATARAIRDERNLPHTSRVALFVTILRKVGRDDLRLVTAAVRGGRKGVDEVRAVAEYNPALGGYHYREMEWKFISGWCVDWNAERNEREKVNYIYNGGNWCYRAWYASDPDEFAKWDGRTYSIPCDKVANPEVLAHTRYRYCGWNPATMASCALAPILAAYAVDERTELLCKAGLFNPFSFSPLATPKKVEELAKNARLRKLLCQDPTLARRYAWNDLKWLCADPRRTIEDMELERVSPHRFFAAVRQSLPKGMSVKECHAYCVKNKVDAGQYCEAMTLAQKEGLDIRARCTAFPTDFPAFYAQRAENEDARASAEVKARDALIGKFVDELRALVEKHAKKLNLGDWQIVWLTKQREFRMEGNNMGNCIGGGGYSSRMAARDCVCLALAREGEGRVDVEIGDGWKVKQCYARKNTTPPADAREVAQRLAELFRKHRKQLERRLAA